MLVPRSRLAIAGVITVAKAATQPGDGDVC